MLAAEVTLWAAGGGKARGAATRPVVGRDAVTRFVLGTKRLWPEGARTELGDVNGQAALVIHVGDHAFSVLSIEAEQGQIQAIHIIANPEKLAQVYYRVASRCWSMAFRSCGEPKVGRNDNLRDNLQEYSATQ